MKLRIFVPPDERPAAGARWPWILLDASHGLLREDATRWAAIAKATGFTAEE